MAKMDASNQLVATLREWDVDTVFGLPGDGINGIIEAFRQCRDKIRFIQVRHEEAAAFMACAYAKYTGRLGVCIATSGPGAIHLLNGLYDAKMDHAPVLAITGMTYHDLIGQQYQQDVDTQALFQDVAVYNERIMGPTDVRELANIACREAVYNQAVAHITFPVDLQVEPASPEERGVYGSADCTAGARTSRSGRLHVSPSPSGGVRLPQVQGTLKNHVPVRDVQEENPNAQLFAAGADGTWTQQRRCPRSAGYGHAHNRAPRPRFHQNNG